MTQQIDSGALELLRQALGLAGGSGASQVVFLEDGEVIQTLDVSSLVAASTAPVQTGGLFVIQAQNTHVGGTPASDTIDIYETDLSQPNAPTGLTFPGPIPAGVEVWCYAAGLLCSIGANVVGAAISLDPAGNFPGKTDGLTSLQTVPMWAWGAPAALAGGIDLGTSQTIPLIYQPPGPVRLPRASSLVFESQSNNPVDVTFSMLCALAPRGLRPSAF